MREWLIGLAGAVVGGAFSLAGTMLAHYLQRRSDDERYRANAYETIIRMLGSPRELDDGGRQRLKHDALSVGTFIRLPKHEQKYVRHAAESLFTLATTSDRSEQKREKARISRFAKVFYELASMRPREATVSRVQQIAKEKLGELYKAGDQ